MPFFHPKQTLGECPLSTQSGHKQPGTRGDGPTAELAPTAALPAEREAGAHPDLAAPANFDRPLIQPVGFQGRAG